MKTAKEAPSEFIGQDFDEFLKDEAKMDENIRAELVKRMGLTAVAPRPAPVAPVMQKAPAAKK